MKKENIFFYRGLGTGIIITVVIMFLSMNYFEKNGDNEIKDNVNEKKEEIVKQETLKEAIIKQKEPEQGKEQIQPSNEIEKDMSDNKEQMKEELKKEIKEELKAEAKAKEEAKVREEVVIKETKDTIVEEEQAAIIIIEPGMNSYDVAVLIMKKGLVKDAYDFNMYMETEGKGDRVQVGTFKINKGSTYDEILDIIVG